jgi:hypothetical protein
MAAIVVELWAFQVIGVTKAVTVVTSAVTIAAGATLSQNGAYRLDESSSEAASGRHVIMIADVGTPLRWIYRVQNESWPHVRPA